MFDSKTCKVILASSSPRRKAILEQIGFEPEILPSGFAEDLEKNLFPNPGAYTETNSLIKALHVFKNIRTTASFAPGEKVLIVAADTVVFHEGKILEKPDSKLHAFDMLKSMSGKTHEVISGVSLVSFSDSELALEDSKLPFVQDLLPIRARAKTFHVSTRVKFVDVSDELIRRYVDSGEPMYICFISTY